MSGAEGIGESGGWAFFVPPSGEAYVGQGPFEAAAEPPASGVAFYVNDFGLGVQRPWRIPAHWERTTGGALGRRFAGGGPPVWEWVEPDAGAFAEVFQEVAGSIRRGVFEKTVPVAVEHGRLVAGEAAAAACCFTEPGSACYGYGWIEGGRGFAGATPELLLARDGLRLSTMALAGTARREERQVFEVDDKEIREHEFVAQALVAKLTGLGEVRRQERRVLDLGSIVHFHTPIEVGLSEPVVAGSLVARLHPTPALGPLPRTAETMALLLDWRERLGCPAGFGAPFGLWHDGRFEVVVAIRGLWWDGARACLPAGCGVIEASRLVNEWRELRLKREAVKGCLAQRSRG